MHGPVVSWKCDRTFVSHLSLVFFSVLSTHFPADTNLPSDEHFSLRASAPVTFLSSPLCVVLNSFIVFVSEVVSALLELPSTPDSTGEGNST